MEDLTVNIQLTNQKVHFTAISESHPEITLPVDFTPPLGDGEGLTGIEMLLLSFGGCISTAVVLLLRRTGKKIASYSAKVTGERNERPLYLKKILFEVDIQSEDITPEEIEEVLKQAEQISPAWLAMKNNVEIVAGYHLS